jgi:hypothetical protein
VRLTLLLLGLSLTGGCSTRADQVFGAPGRLVTGSSGPQPGYTIKLVRAKEAPSDVVADDGSVCRLTAERFAGVEAGDWLSCEWNIRPDTAESVERVMRSTGVERVEGILEGGRYERVLRTTPEVRFPIS